MSDNYNDLPTDDLNYESVYIKFVGKNNDDEIYLDMFGGWIDTDDITENYMRTTCLDLTTQQ